MSRHLKRIAVLVSLASFAGCGGRAVGNFAGNVASRVVAQPDPAVELLQSELRWMEDNLYRMDDQLESCLAQLESSRRNNAVLRMEIAELRGASGRPGGDSETPGQTQQQGNQDGDRIGLQGPFDEERDDFQDPSFKLPDIRLGDAQEDPAQENPAQASPAVQQPAGDVKLEQLPDPSSLEPRDDSDPPSGIPPGNPFKGDAEPAEPEPASADEVTRIKLNRKLTGGFNFDGRPGHEGVMVVIEPQNAYSQYVPLPGPITVEVRDPANPGLAGRIGKWKFDEVEASAMMKKTPLGEGIHLELPWPGAPPQSEQLSLLVSYQTPDGRRIDAQKNIRVELQTSALVSKADKAERQWSPYRRPNSAKRTATAPTWQSAR